MLRALLSAPLPWCHHPSSVSVCRISPFPPKYHPGITFGFSSPSKLAAGCPQILPCFSQGTCTCGWVPQGWAQPLGDAGGLSAASPPARGTSISTCTAAEVCPWFLGHGKWSEQGRAWLLSQPRAPPPLATSPAPPRSQDLDLPLGLRGQGAVVVVLPTLCRVKSRRVPRSRARARRKRARGKAKRATATVARLRAWETGGDREIY